MVALALLQTVAHHIERNKFAIFRLAADGAPRHNDLHRPAVGLDIVLAFETRLGMDDIFAAGFTLHGHIFAVRNIADVDQRMVDHRRIVAALHKELHSVSPPGFAGLAALAVKNAALDFLCIVIEIQIFIIPSCLDGGGQGFHR